MSPSEADILRRGRNVIWRIYKLGFPCVVKTFSSKLDKKLIYTFSKSKACRSYETAIELCKRGIDTPEPIGFAEIRNMFGILTHCCYASLYVESAPLSEAIKENGEEVVKIFAQFVVKLHEKGILHNDLNDSNVRYRIDESGKYHFSLIDLNRARLTPMGKTPSLKRCFIDTYRCWMSPELYKTFAETYLEARGLPPKLKSKMISGRLRFNHQKAKTKKVTKYIKNIFGIDMADKSKQ